MLYRLTDWLTDWLTDRQTNRQTGGQVNWMPECLTDRLTDWLTDWQTGRLTEWQTGRLTDRQADWLTDRQTDWMTDWGALQWRYRKSRQQILAQSIRQAIKRHWPQQSYTALQQNYKRVVRDTSNVDGTKCTQSSVCLRNRQHCDYAIWHTWIFKASWRFGGSSCLFFWPTQSMKDCWTLNMNARRFAETWENSH